MNLKDLKALRQEERVQRIKQARQLREDGMIIIDKNGKSHTVSTGISMSDRDIVGKNVNRRLYERAKQFSDRRGVQFEDEGTAGRLRNGEMNIANVIR